jgi:hypothetical protein
MGIKLAKTRDEDKIIRVVKMNRKDYWDNKIERHPLLSYKLLFDYSTHEKVLGANDFLFMLNYKDPGDIGKKENTIIYSVYYGKLDYPELINVSKSMSQLTDTLSVPYVIKLDDLYNKEINNNILKYGKDYLELIDRPIKRVQTIDEHIIASVVYPPALSYQSYENNLLLANRLEEYISGKLRPQTKLIDITDLLYTKDKKDKTILKKEIVNDKYDIKIDMKKYGIDKFKKPLILKLQYDLPRRNHLKKLESMNPKVVLMVDVFDLFMRYMTVLEITENNEKKYLLTDNIYADKVYFRK